MNQKERIRTKLQIINQRLEMYYQAEEAILSGAQSYQISNRKLTRADLSQIQNEIIKLENEKEMYENALINGSTKRKTVRVIYRDL